MLGDIDFGEILQALQASGLVGDPSRLGELGMDFSDPEKLKELLEKMGPGCGVLQNQDELISQINRLTAAFGCEKRQQIGELFLEMARQMGCEELPPDFLDFLERWKKGG